MDQLPTPSPVAEERCRQLLGSLPPFPPLALRLTRLLANQQADIREILELLSADPALSAELLRRANSAAYGFDSRLDSVQQCLVVLGFAESARVALSLATQRFAGPAMRSPELRRCWRHALVAAVISEEIAKAAGLPPDSAYTAGLLADVGRLGLFVSEPRIYEQLFAEAAAAGPIDDSEWFLAKERELFGVDHCEAGRWLAGHWHMPLELQAVAGRHHDRPKSTEFTIVEAVHCAFRLADALGYGVADTVTTGGFEAILEDLPPRVQAGFWRGPEALRGLAAARLKALEGRQPEPVESEPESPEPAAAEEEQAAVSEPPPSHGGWEYGAATLVVVASLVAALAIAFWPAAH